MAILPTFLPLNPDVDKLSILNHRTNYDDPTTLDEQFVDLKDTYYYTFHLQYEKQTLLKEEVLNMFRSFDEDLKISTDVLKQSFLILEGLYPSILESFDIENLTRTPYGTVVLDWEKDSNNFFSLEIGANKIGYFIEKDGVDIKQVDSEDFSTYKNQLVRDLGLFLD